MATRGARVKVVGFERLEDALKGVEDDIRAGAAIGIETALHETREAWASRVPVKDGNYRRAMQQENAVRVYIRKGRDPYGYLNVPWVKGVKGKDQPQRYARRLEYGDADRSPQPSARPAVDSTQARMVELLGDGIAVKVKASKPKPRNVAPPS